MTKHRYGRLPGRLRATASLAVVLALAAVAAALATAHSAAVPSNNAAPSISGTPREGQTLTAGNGTWTGAPTKFEYQWQRCTASGTGCADISGAASRTYTLAAADVDNTVRVVVTASNADGQGNASSKPTDVISSKAGPVNKTPPSISGTPAVGEELTAAPGTWTGGATSFSYQWERCAVGGTGCVSVAGATGNSYGVRAADAGKAVRVVVTAKSSGGSSVASSSAVSIRSTTTTTTTPTPAGNKAPTITFISLKKAGIRAYARFRVCDDSAKVTVTQRDTKPGKLAYTRRFTFSTGRGCSTQARNWILAARFRGHGRYTATLRAADPSGKASGTVSRSLFF